MSVDINVWGPATWVFLHTITEKVKEHEFDNQKNNLLSIIKKICSILPCPDCAQDATNILNQLNYNTINNKTDFKMYIFQFHNHINKKLNKPQENINILDKYKKSNLTNILFSLKIIYTQNINIPKLMIHSLHRKSTINDILVYFNNNMDKFD
jgi:hypothetical protein